MSIVVSHLLIYTNPSDERIGQRRALSSPRSDPIAEALHADGRPVTRAAWLMAAFGTRSETPLTYDKETREWVNRHFPRDPDEPVT